MGRAIVDAAVQAGHQVTTLNRGQTGADPLGVTLLRGDRTDHQTLADLLHGHTWDMVFDTWSGAPIHATTAAQLLADRSHHYVYVSSRSVYSSPLAVGADESHPVVQADPLSEASDDYAVAKRGSEMGILDVFPNALLARAGLILGPREDVGRLPWWLRRVARGGPVLAPGPMSRPLQYVDARDLAAWVLACAQERVGGAFNTVSQSGFATMGSLLKAAHTVTKSDATFVWLTPEEIESAGVQPWTELPIWLPPDHEAGGLHDCDVSAAVSAGLRCRPLLETVVDTWNWLSDESPDTTKHIRAAMGLDPEREAAILAAHLA